MAQRPQKVVFCGDTIYNDNTSGVIWVEKQMSLGSVEDVMGMMNLKKLIWDQESAEINNFRGNNGIFTVDGFRKDFQQEGSI